MKTYTYIDPHGGRSINFAAATTTAAAEHAIRLARKLGHYSIGDAAGFSTRNLRVEDGAYIGGDDLRGLLIEFEVCGLLGPIGRGDRPSGDYSPRTLRLLSERT